MYLFFLCVFMEIPNLTSGFFPIKYKKSFKVCKYELTIKNLLFFICTICFSIIFIFTIKLKKYMDFYKTLKQ